MPPRKIEIAPELVAEGKRLYERTQTPIADIAGLMGISRRTLENRLHEWQWQPRRLSSRRVDLLHAVRGAVAAAASDPTRPAPAEIEPVSEQQRQQIAARIHNAVEREIAAVEKVLNMLGPADQAEAERSSRTLASIARTLREIAALTQPDQQAAPDETDDDPVPRDIDEFRNELARRIRGFIERRRNGAGRLSDEPEGSLA